jgi:uncharacterized protein (DUF111 family)
MRTAHVDASRGVTGDAWLGALIDAGASLQHVQAAVDTLGIGGVRVAYAQVTRDGTRASLVRVRAPAQTPVVRTWREIRHLLAFAALDDDVRRHAIDVLALVAAAEAASSGCETDEATFHEVAAVTMLTDVIGTCAAISHLGLDRMTTGPVATGHGVLHTVHGDLDLPDPRVTRILAGFPTVPGPVGDVEATTPVGAALVAHYCEPGQPPDTEADLSVAVGAGDNGAHLTIGVRT